MPWNPDQYLAFADERALPFHHLVASVGRLAPRRVLDIGCGPGALTATLLDRFPSAEILGIDSSEEMIEHARRRAVPDRLCFELTDINSFSPDSSVDLIVSNACLHWIEDHRRLLERLTEMLTDHGTLALQVPANHDRPSHTILAELCACDRWRHLLADAFRVHVRPPEWYAAELESLGYQTAVWQTTYLHQLTGDDPVLEWVKGTTLRPILDRLDDKRAASFLDEYGARLRGAYPKTNGVTLFDFTRTFVCARAGSGGG